MVRKRGPTIIILIFLLMAILLNTTRPVSSTSAPATIQVAPSTSTVNGGTTFKVNVTVTNVTNLYAWEFGLYYLNTILGCVNVTEGPFLKQGGSTFWALIINNTYNATHGWILAGSSLTGAVPGVNGSGTLATITFQAKAGGDTSLHFSNESTVTFLLEQPGSIYLPYTTIDGIVHVPAAHDVAVTSIISYKKVVFRGFSADFDVTVENRGMSQETFNVTLYANMTITGNTTAIAKKAIIGMPNGTSTILNFTWDTTGFAKGNYTIYAMANVVQGETNVDNNKFTDGQVKVSMIGDLTGGSANPWDFVPDGVVDGSDLSIVAKCFGSWPGAQPPLTWNVNCDVNNDGVVDGSDLAIVAKHFGEGYLP